MDPLQWLAEFYKQNKELSLVLVSLLGGALLTKLVPTLYAQIKRLIFTLGRRAGGRLAYRAIQNDYLNWVVLQNQDLNLTGIIGLGQKPKLEQIFISLKLSKSGSKDTDHEQSSKKSRSRWRSNIERLAGWIRNSPYKIINRILDFFVPSTPNSNLSLFRPKRLWRIRMILKRDGMRATLAFAIILLFFVLLPAYFLIISTTPSDSLVIIISIVFVSFLAFASIFDVLQNRKSQDSWVIFACFGVPSLLVIISTFAMGIYSYVNILGGIVGGGTFAIISERDIKIPFLNRTAIKHTAKDLGDLLSSNNNIAILGNPGSGKSTLLQYIALTFAEDKAGERKFHRTRIARKRFAMPLWYLPVLIPLRKVSNYIKSESEGRSNGNLLINAFREEILPADFRDDFSPGFIRNLLKKKKCLFLLDGLDEVANDEEFRSVVNEIRGLLSRYPGNKIVITSRYAGWRGGTGSEFVEMEVEDLNSNQIGSFVVTWYNAVETNRSLIIAGSESITERKYRLERANEKAKKLFDALETTESIRNLAKNPLLLSMICFVHYNKILPKERLSLYDDCSRLLLEQWEIEKGRTQDDIPLNLLRKETIMQEIAFAVHSGKIGSGIEQKEALSTDIIPIISRVLEKFDMDPSLAEGLFQKLVSRTGIIVATEKFKDLYGFNHLTFQEYYTAKYLYKNDASIFDSIELSKHDSLTSQMNWWSEVIALYSGMQRDIAPIIGRLCANNPDDLMRQGLQIAARCSSEAVEAPHSDVESLLLSQLLNIRVRDNASNLTRPLLPEVKRYLFRFAMSNRFYAESLHMFVRSKDKKDEIANTVRSLVKIAQSTDSVIVDAVAGALVEIWESGNISDLLEKEDLEYLFATNRSDLLLALTKLVNTKFSGITDESFIDIVLDNTIEWLLDFLPDSYDRTYSYFSGAAQDMCNTFLELSAMAFAVKHRYIQDRVVKTLDKLLNNCSLAKNS
jgi:energy-coupling factor transporter ATP-binding protein EcfA2